jgi:hypothetical protein
LIPTSRAFSLTSTAYAADAELSLWL